MSSTAISTAICTCSDCGQDFVVPALTSGGGRYPSRCDACRYERKCQQQRLYYQRDKARRSEIGKQQWASLTPEQRDQKRKQMRAYNARPDVRARVRAKVNARRKQPEVAARRKGPERWRSRGLSDEQFHALLIFQGGRCALCSLQLENPANGRGGQVHIDHDHDHDCKRGCAGCVRGLLCHRCNRGGKPDSLEELERRMAYLKNPPSKQAWAHLTKGT